MIARGDPLAAIAADPAALVDDLLARADTELTAAAKVVEQNRVYSGEPHKIGGALESLRFARFALDIASALLPARSAR
jgi:hypothetical protein